MCALSDMTCTFSLLLWSSQGQVKLWLFLFEETSAGRIIQAPVSTDKRRQKKASKVQNKSQKHPVSSNFTCFEFNNPHLAAILQTHPCPTKILAHTNVNRHK